MYEKLNTALNRVSDRHLQEAEEYRRKAWPRWAAAVAAVLAITILVGVLAGPNLRKPVLQGTEPSNVTGPAQLQSPAELNLVNLVGAPQYPQMVQKPNRTDYGNDYNAYSAAEKIWREDQKAQYDQPKDYAASLTGFFARSIREFLKEEKNVVYSPVNVYMALAMLAETTGGNSRQQLLELFGLDSIEQLRAQASYVWNAHYADDGETTLLLGNSLWLDDFYSFHQNTVDTLANNYYASVLHGDLGSQAMNTQLQTWINAHTGGLLKEQAGNIKLEPATVFALASTVYFAAGWEEKFSEKNSTQEKFHCKDYDLLTTFMNRSFIGTYYWGEDFGAVRLNLQGYNAMWLILPDKGVTVDQVLESDEYLQMTLNPGQWEDQRTMKIHLSLPKFDVTSQKDLIEGMKNLGVTDIFDPSVSDFSPITSTDDLYVGKIDHAGRVVVDEEGVIAAAFTLIDILGTGLPQEQKEIEFTLDRPFLFIVSSRDQLPLFSGVVHEP